MMTKIICICASVLTGVYLTSAEVPGEFRPQPTLHPAEIAGATGTNVQPLDTYPVSHAPLVNTAQRKPKLANPGEPAVRGNELVFNAGWEMIEAPRLKIAASATLSRPGVDTRDWYDATDSRWWHTPYFGGMKHCVECGGPEAADYR